MSNIKPIDISLLRVNGGTQSRSEINKSVVSDYAEAMTDGAVFPPLVVFYDGTDYWLADGFHRYEAYSRAKIYDAIADIRQGTQRDAVLFSVGANASHGLRRTNDDKRRAVMVLLNDPEWARWSARDIAKQCGVSHDFAARLKREVSSDDSERTYTTKHGTTSTMNTAAIGKPLVPEIHQQVSDNLSPEVKALQARKEEAKGKQSARTEELQARVDEIEESQTVLERDYAEVLAENKKFEAMRVLFERGGFDAVVAAKDEEIRVLKERVFSESAGKAEWMRKAEYWKGEAKKLGWRDKRQDKKVEPLSDEDAFLAAVAEAEA